MNIRTSRMTALLLAFAVWLAYSVPAHATSRGNAGNNPSASVVQSGDDDEDTLSGGALAVLLAIGVASVVQTDDDDDDLSGGALAVLLLAIGGAVAGVLYATASHRRASTVALNRAAGNTVTVSMDGTDTNGKQSRSRWTGKLDGTSGTIRVTMAGTDATGKSTYSQWTGKADGRYYSVTGDPSAGEISYTKVDDHTLAFSGRKAGRITLTGRIVVSANGRSFTISTDRVDSTGQRVSRQAVYSAR